MAILFRLKLVSTSFMCLTKRKHFKTYEKCFLFYQKAPFILDTFKFLHFPLPLFFPLSATAGFKEVDWR